MVKNAYEKLKDIQQKRVNAFDGWFFAFSDKQFDEGMKKVGLEPDELGKIYRIGGGGFVRKDRAEEMDAMFERNRKEIQDAIEADKIGNGFILDMFNYELANHEYGITGDLEETLDSLNLTMDEINASYPLLNGLGLAIERQLECAH